MTLDSAIQLAHRLLADGDAEGANYALRDLPETKKAGLDDLSWAMHQGGCGKNDVLYLISQLEKEARDE